MTVEVGERVRILENNAGALSEGQNPEGVPIHMNLQGQSLEVSRVGENDCDVVSRDCPEHPYTFTFTLDKVEPVPEMRIEHGTNVTITFNNSSNESSSTGWTTPMGDFVRGDLRDMPGRITRVSPEGIDNRTCDVTVLLGKGILEQTRARFTFPLAKASEHFEPYEGDPFENDSLETCDI